MAHLSLAPEAWALAGVLATALIGGVGHLLGRRSAREQTIVEARKVTVDQRRVDDEGLRAAAGEWRELASTHGERLARLEGQMGVLQHERQLDQAWISLLRDHIIRGDPPPPPQRPTSL